MIQFLSDCIPIHGTFSKEDSKIEKFIDFQLFGKFSCSPMIIIEILARVFPILLETSNNVPVSHPISTPPLLKDVVSELNNCAPVFNSALLRTMISPLDICNPV